MQRRKKKDKQRNKGENSQRKFGAAISNSHKRDLCKSSKTFCLLYFVTCGHEVLV